MEKQRRQYSAEFREEALRLWRSSGKSAAEVEQDLGITAGLLSKWKARQQRRAEPASTETGDKLEAEVRRLRRENTILREERDILKKEWVCSRRTGHEIRLRGRTSGAGQHSADVSAVTGIAKSWYFCDIDSRNQRDFPFRGRGYSWRVRLLLQAI